MKKFLISVICAMCVCSAFAVGENVPTSKSYVDTALSQKQDTIPASSGAAQVLTNTGTPGEYGTKNIYDSSAAYETQTNSLVTAGAMNAAVQNAIEVEFKCVSWVDDDQTKECLLLDIGGPTKYAQYELFGPNRDNKRFFSNFNAEMTFDQNTNIVTFVAGNLNPKAANVSMWVLYNGDTAKFASNNYFINGHKYYFYARMQNLGPSIRVSIRRDTATSSRLNVSTQWGVHGAIFTASFDNDGNTHYPILAFEYPYENYDGVIGIQIDQNEMGLYDLTDIFGAGNEPATPDAAARALNLVFMPYGN